MESNKAMKRIRAGRYEDGTFGIRQSSTGLWQTFRLANEENNDGGWMQSYGTLREARAGLLDFIQLRAAIDFLNA